MPCDAILRDDFNHICKITGPYTLECDKYTTFNYTDKIEVWHNDKCCGNPKIDNSWHVQILFLHIVEVMIGTCTNIVVPFVKVIVPQDIDVFIMKYNYRLAITKK
jgi:hypothetical protein